MDDAYRPITAELTSGWLPPRPTDSHKGDFGSVGVLGGAPGMAGAALLAGRAALWLGAGRVYCGLIDERIPVDFSTPELMLTTPEHVLLIPTPACLVAGPGLGQTVPARDWLQAALATSLPIVLDADALNLVATKPTLAEMVHNRPVPTVLTPHPGEAARLLGQSIAAIQADRLAAVQKLTEHYGCGCVLKGSASLVHFPDGPVWRNETGNSGMAAPGMGDVLGGMIGALVAQGLSLERAAVLGVHLHGAAGDAAVRSGSGPVGLSATEVALAARRLLNERATGHLEKP